MTIAFYFDDNCADVRVLSGLRADGLVVESPVDAGISGASDDQHLEYASARAMTLVTADRGDFARLSAAWLKSGRHHAGIVIIKQQHLSAGEQRRRLRRLAQALDEDAMGDRVEYLSRWGGPDEG